MAAPRRERVLRPGRSSCIPFLIPFTLALCSPSPEASPQRPPNEDRERAAMALTGRGAGRAKGWAGGRARHCHFPALLPVFGDFLGSTVFPSYSRHVRSPRFRNGDRLNRPIREATPPTKKLRVRRRTLQLARKLGHGLLSSKDHPASSPRLLLVFPRCPRCLLSLEFGCQCGKTGSSRR